MISKREYFPIGTVLIKCPDIGFYTITSNPIEDVIFAGGLRYDVEFTMWDGYKQMYNMSLIHLHKDVQQGFYSVL